MINHLPLPRRFDATEKIFHSAPRQRTARAQVLHVDREFVVLDRTIFYAESGGQESDHGMLGGIPVVHVFDQSGRLLPTIKSRVPLPSISVDTVVVHRLDRPAPFLPGDEVDLEIDWSRRYGNMRFHSACHFMFHAVQTVYASRQDPLMVKGCHIHPAGARIDFHGELEGDRLASAQELSNDLIGLGDEIRMEAEAASNEIFYWCYKDIVPIPCGGTHVASARELGQLKFRRSKKGRGVTRISVEMIDC